MPRVIAPDQLEARATAASQGDNDALSELYEHYHDHVQRFITLHTRGDTSAVDDLSAATWERVARSIGTYTTRKEGFTAWLFTVTRNCLTDHYRRVGRRREVLTADLLLHDPADPADEPEAALDGKLRREEVAAAVNSLSKPQRQCVTLRFFVGLSLADTAAVMGKNVNAVKQLQHRGLLTLRRRLGPIPQSRATAGTYLAVDPVGRQAVSDTSGGEAR